ncbi:hypothetical protein F4825DRAFT_452395 [Nemania diffusa]|nr:hypothetical protein F4825DRAFT_452395 [Nemania diffusa]
MKFASAFFWMARAAASVSGYDVSNMPDGVYKIPIGDNGVIDYDNALNLNISSSNLLGRRFLQANVSIDGVEGEDDPDHDYDDNDGDDDDDDDKYGDNDILPGPGHCHWHYPHHRNRFIVGHTMMNLTNYPLTLAMFMDWMTTGADGGWLERGEVRMAKSNDVVVGACVFKRPRLATCVHELSLAMMAADRECASGKVGCHACIQNWHKDYFRFAATEAPNQCECAWYYWK